MMDGLDLRPATHTSRAQADDEDRIRLSWPREQLAQALEALASRTGLRAAEAGAIGTPDIPPPGASVYAGNWIEWAAGCLGLEAEPVEFPVPDLVQGLLRACPLVLALPVTGEACRCPGALPLRMAGTRPAMTMRRVSLRAGRPLPAGVNSHE
jgi:hypothetical protein